MALKLLNRWGKQRPVSLEDVLGVEPYKANKHLPPITWRHHKPGTVVSVVGGLQALVGLRGVVSRIWECGGIGTSKPDNDLYLIKLEGGRTLAVEYLNLRGV